MRLPPEIHIDPRDPRAPTAEAWAYLTDAERAQAAREAERATREAERAAREAAEAELAMLRARLAELEKGR